MFVERTSTDYRKIDQVAYSPKKKVAFETGKGQHFRWEPESVWGNAIHETANGRVVDIRWIPQEQLKLLLDIERHQQALTLIRNELHKEYRRILAGAFEVGRPLTVEEIQADQAGAKKEGAAR